MNQFSFSRWDDSVLIIAQQVNVTYEIIEDTEKSWEVFATRIIDALTEWCQSTGITAYGIGHTQIAINITFSESRDAMLFKLRWHSAKTTKEGLHRI